MPNWISIKEKLPTPMEDVLFLNINNTMFIGCLEPDEELIRPARKGEYTEIIGVTHWMPLPEPPKWHNEIMYKVVVKTLKEKLSTVLLKID